MANPVRPVEVADDDWAARLGTLKSQLAKNPEDQAVRRELVEMYRKAKHLDQAGRYAVAIDGLATKTELRAYGSMLRGLAADDDRMRALSRLPPGVTIADAAREVMNEQPPAEGLLDTGMFVVWAIVVGTIIVAPLATFFPALAGSAATQGVAITSGAIVIASTIVASAWTCCWAAVRKSWRSAAIWGTISAALIVCGALLVPR